MNKYQLIMETVLEKANETSVYKRAKIVNLETGEEKYIVDEIMEVFVDFVKEYGKDLESYKKMGTPDEIQNVINDYFLNKPAFEEYVKMFGDIETARKIYSDEFDSEEETPVEESITEETAEEKPAKKGLI